MTHWLDGGYSWLILDTHLKTRIEVGYHVVLFHYLSIYQVPYTGKLWASPAVGCISLVTKV